MVNWIFLYILYIIFYFKISYAHSGNINARITNNNFVNFKIIKKYWGNININHKKYLFIYLNNYKSRIFINVNKNQIIIETFLCEYYKNILFSNIIDILLIYNIDILYNIENILFNLNNKYYSIDNILNFSIFFIEKNMKTRLLYNNKIIKYINIYYKIDYNKLIYDYINLINKNINIYKIDKFLLLSIIKIESNFNNFAISNCKATGLMQVMHNKAGIDVYNKKNIKNPEYKKLFNSKYNIYIGSIYIHILWKKYFYNINNIESLRYLIISSYNGGVLNVTNIFSKDFNKSINIINNMKSSFVYKSIVKHHPSKEIREYLKNVNRLYLYYCKYNNI